MDRAGVSMYNIGNVDTIMSKQWKKHFSQA